MFVCKPDAGGDRSPDAGEYACELEHITAPPAAPALLARVPVREMTHILQRVDRHAAMRWKPLPITENRVRSLTAHLSGMRKRLACTDALM
jgi:hypothetical protein